MTQEDKNLLFHDLCTRLPYGIKVWNEGNVFNIDYISSYGEIHLDIDDDYTIDVSEVKPCLFPISSMTEEQKEEYNQSRLKDLHMLNSVLTERINDENNFDSLVVAYNEIDWLNKNHFDYRGLIENNLAIDATGLNIYRYHPSN